MVHLRILRFSRPENETARRSWGRGQINTWSCRCVSVSAPAGAIVNADLWEQIIEDQVFGTPESFEH
jgi:hypothetical protein